MKLPSKTPDLRTGVLHVQRKNTGKLATATLLIFTSILPLVAPIQGRAEEANPPGIVDTRTKKDKTRPCKQFCRGCTPKEREERMKKDSVK
ncbi:hypothetical protein KJ780_00160 [Candidatus Micrarchaeota archaeon]|nr:hypothetical protein [Candidatus Micrarchaeota archaeon]